MNPPSTRSRLLLLPRELRNIIYEYAFTEPGGLVADATSRYDNWTRFRTACNTSDRTRDANQLRLVCRQLYAETSGLGITYNDLTFQRRGGAVFVSVYDLFDQFVYHCAPGYLSKIKRVTILDYTTLVPEEDVVLARLLSPSLVRFSRAYPSATIIVRFQWNATPYRVDAMRHFLRGNALWPFEIRHYTRSGVCAFARLFEHAAADCSQNLRFSLTMDFDEEKFSEIIARKYVGNEEVEYLVGFFKGLHEDGI
ncbi:hypothetical protein CC86DRAFT_99377 [Ophiobolus disseminans]|uniref:F-box domain-containing protein n=1 Tax=Ophiobolus disseminans TaxID=1469910 RepID=A0A6A6ZLP0_9PLEO|nr:hypothetical protein CC86DRAFT_99377 [Ophiobolus disseminans]